MGEKAASWAFQANRDSYPHQARHRRARMGGAMDSRTSGG
jgi:hypothetical protein